MSTNRNKLQYVRVKYIFRRSKYNLCPRESSFINKILILKRCLRIFMLFLQVNTSMCEIMITLIRDISVYSYY